MRNIRLHQYSKRIVFFGKNSCYRVADCFYNRLLFTFFIYLPFILVTSSIYLDLLIRPLREYL